MPLALCKSKEGQGGGRNWRQWSSGSPPHSSISRHAPPMPPPAADCCMRSSAKSPSSILHPIFHPTHHRQQRTLQRGVHRDRRMGQRDRAEHAVHGATGDEVGGRRMQRCSGAPSLLGTLTIVAPPGKAVAVGICTSHRKEAGHDAQAFQLRHHLRKNTLHRPARQGVATRRIKILWGCLCRLWHHRLKCVQIGWMNCGEETNLALTVARLGRVHVVANSVYAPSDVACGGGGRCEHTRRRCLPTATGHPPPRSRSSVDG